MKPTCGCIPGHYILGPSWGIAAFSCFGAALGSCPRLVRPLRETKDDVSSKAIVRSGGAKVFPLRADRCGAGADPAAMARERPGRPDAPETDRPRTGRLPQKPT